MVENKTKPTAEDVAKFIDSLREEQKRKDSYAIIKLMTEVTGEKPKMWGPSIIGFGSYHYKYDSGHEGDWALTGFSPRKQAISLYLTAGFVGSGNPEFNKILNELGKFKMGKGCLYINKLEDVNVEKLKELVRISVDFLKVTYRH